ncbi:alpha-ketoglutarate-dependent dioxygenase AlkB [Flavobacteriaceae bacterium]|jgi:alkylated DNA repair dioxygenase AlkB|nr:alpha-ketoglutarate-dependent dioxygenase AlkB [Flavobacteriaceae bacterium]MDC0957595.1 alpha-ketoglutarate-dependent dioxygenase AlkB [Flavobacteriaceae bacterium]MDC3269240.1 alpha-ketoglutarate-dependent dioxygenase AlkB [Flavobacteriaceae bacterium]
MQINLNLKDAEVFYYPNYFTKNESMSLFQILTTETLWQQDDIKVFGKTYKQPRLTSLYGSNKRPYSYSNITMHPHKFSSTLLKIKSKIEDTTNEIFTTCLLNQYRDGQDSNGWHADDEKELGQNPVIASVSFGASRMFHLKHRYDKSHKCKLLLESGSLLLMKGTTQHFWLHQVPKTKKQIGSRINLTFRYIK